MFKRYVIDEARTPQFIAVAKLSRTQAHYEMLFMRCWSVPVCGAWLALRRCLDKLPHGDAPLVALYALAAAWATSCLPGTRTRLRDVQLRRFRLRCCSTSSSSGFPGALGGYDRYLVLGIVVLWALYAGGCPHCGCAFPV